MIADYCGYLSTNVVCEVRKNQTFQAEFLRQLYGNALKMLSEE